MKVLHLRSSNFYGGPERQIQAHAKESIASDVEIIVASFSEKGKSPAFIERIATDNIRVHVFRVTGPYDFDVLSRIRSFLHNNSINIICTHDYKSHILAALATRKLPTRWIAFSRGKTRENIKTILFQFLSSFAMRFCDSIVCVAHSEALRLRRRRRFFRKEKISVIPNAILDLGEDEIQRIDLRERFAFDRDSIIVLSAGRFSAEKGQRYLIEAARIAQREEPLLRFVLFGDGPDLQSIRVMLKELALEETTLCPGFEANMAGCLLDADIIVNPSLSEALPNIVLEAIANNKPIVATAVGGVPDIITDGVNGLLVEPQNASALAKAILVASAKLGEVRSVSEKRNLELIEELSVANQFKRLLALYEAVVYPS